jgi:hypothetical protein
MVNQVEKLVPTITVALSIIATPSRAVSNEFT